MQHLDEGLLMALLDGELKGAEQLDAETHLRTCTECAARFAELKGFMLEADGLVADLGEPPAHAVDVPRLDQGRRPSRILAPRTLAWAASIVAALGLGFAGSQWWLRSGKGETNYAAGAAEGLSDSFSPVATPAPSAAPPQVALQEERVSQPREGAAPPGQAAPADEIGRREADSSSRLNNEILALRPNAAEVGQAANQSGDQDAAGAAAGRADSQPTRESSAKLADLARGRDSRSERLLAPAPAAPLASGSLRRELVSGPVFQRIPMEEAVRQLGGAIRLIDGFTPEEFELAAGDSAQALVRVTYRVGPAESRLFLEQGRVDNSFVASDLQTLPQVVEPSSGVNRLSWNDLRGFALTLSGRFSADSLSHFKTLVK